MGRFKEIFSYAYYNDIKKLNNSIMGVGRKHHKEYMKNMMFSDDIYLNHQLLSETQKIIHCYYKVVNDNYLIKGYAQDLLENQCKYRIFFERDFKVLTDEQMFELVYQQAMKYYFRIEVNNNFSSDSFFDEALQYRIVSTFMQNDIKRILEKIYEDIEIIAEDTKNIDFLMNNYMRLDKSDNRCKCFVELLTEGIQNTLLRDNNFAKEYFVVVQKIGNILRQSISGG